MTRRGLFGGLLGGGALAAHWSALPAWLPIPRGDGVSLAELDAQDDAFINELSDALLSEPRAPLATTSDQPRPQPPLFEDQSPERVS